MHRKIGTQHKFLCKLHNDIFRSREIDFRMKRIGENELFRLKSRLGFVVSQKSVSRVTYSARFVSCLNSLLFASNTGCAVPTTIVSTISSVKFFGGNIAVIYFPPDSRNKA